MNQREALVSVIEFVRAQMQDDPQLKRALKVLEKRAELLRVRHEIAAKTWPDKWDGSEPLASLPYAKVNPDGSVQPIMEALMQ